MIARYSFEMSTVSASCSICGGKPTVRSHLIPQAFIRDVRGDDKYVLLTDRDRSRRRIIQGGTFSPDIFCDEHEAVTGVLDSVAVNFCRAVYAGPPLRAGTAFQVTGFETSILIRFACSILLRCHFSRRDEARLINLGPDADNLCRVVFDSDLSNAPDVYVYSAVSAILDFRHLGSMPASMVVDGHRRWSFQGGGMAFVVDIGRPSPAFPNSLLRPGRTVTGPVFDFEQTTLATSWRSLMDGSG